MRDATSQADGQTLDTATADQQRESVRTGGEDGEEEEEEEEGEERMLDDTEDVKVIHV